MESSKLNVGPNGTWFSLIIFSNKDNTKEKFGFGARTTKYYLDYIKDHLKWVDVSGDLTMTGTAFEIADTKVPLCICYYALTLIEVVKNCRRHKLNQLQCPKVNYIKCNVINK